MGEDGAQVVGKSAETSQVESSLQPNKTYCAQT